MFASSFCAEMDIIVGIDIFFNDELKGMSILVNKPKQSDCHSNTNYLKWKKKVETYSRKETAK